MEREMESKCNNDLEKDVIELKCMVKSQNKRIDELIRHIKDGCKAQEADDEPKSNVSNLNPYLECLNPDILYHLNLDTNSIDFPKVFGDVRFVCMGGTEPRMEKLANFIMKEIGLKINPSIMLRNISADAHRYALYKVGPVLCASHGIGGPSIAILLNELIKMMHYAKCQDPIFIRVGTSGGIGVVPGTVVITSEALDGQLRAVHEVVVNSQPQQRPSILNQDLANEIKSLSNPDKDGFDTILGKTLCANDFYEGQSRLDGAFCDFKPDQRIAFLQKISDSGVVNIEMESLTFAAITNQANIRAAVVCVTILNRLEGDQINSAPEELKEFDRRPQVLIGRFLRKSIYGDPPQDDECKCADEP